MNARRTHLILALGAAALVAPSAASAAAPRCATADLQARVAGVQAGAGQRQANLVLRNISGSTCRTQGWVGLQLADSKGRAIPTSTDRVSGPAPKVRLRPGQRARATLQWTVVATGSEPDDGPCERTPTNLLVIPPDETTQTTARWTQGPVCDRGRFEVGPLR